MPAGQPPGAPRSEARPRGARRRRRSHRVTPAGIPALRRPARGGPRSPHAPAEHGPDPFGAFRTGQPPSDFGVPLEQGIELRPHPLRVAARRGVGGREQYIGHPGERRHDDDGACAALRAADETGYPLQCLGVGDGCAAELEDRRIGVTVRWCWRLTQTFTSGATRTTVDTVDCGMRALRKTNAARYRAAFGRPAEAGRRAGGGKKRRNGGSGRRPWSSAKAARGPATVSSGTGRGGAGPYGAVFGVRKIVQIVHDSCDTVTHYPIG